MSKKCGFIDGWLTCDLAAGHDGLHEDHWIGGKPAPSTTGQENER